MRNDHLIGLHLLMRLIQENLVIQMVERDQELRTNFHRFGEGEKLPDSIDLSKINYSSKPEILNYISNLGKWYDQKLQSHFPEYQKRWKALFGESYSRKEQNEYFQSLDKQQLIKLRDEFGVKYFVFYKRKEAELKKLLKPVFTGKRFAVYDLFKLND